MRRLGHVEEVLAVAWRGLVEPMRDGGSYTIDGGCGGLTQERCRLLDRTSPVEGPPQPGCLKGRRQPSGLADGVAGASVEHRRYGSDVDQTAAARVDDGLLPNRLQPCFESSGRSIEPNETLMACRVLPAVLRRTRTRQGIALLEALDRESDPDFHRPISAGARILRPCGACEPSAGDRQTARDTRVASCEDRSAPPATRRLSWS